MPLAKASTVRINLEERLRAAQAPAGSELSIDERSRLLRQEALRTGQAAPSNIGNSAVAVLRRQREQALDDQVQMHMAFTQQLEAKQAEIDVLQARVAELEAKIAPSAEVCVDAPSAVN